MEKVCRSLCDCFLPPLRWILSEQIASQDCEEIHIGRGRRVFVKLSSSGVRMLDHVCTSDEFDLILKKICRGSVYAHDESMKMGFISFMDGIRVGVSGRAVCLDDKILSLRRVDSLNVRLPRYPKNISSPLVDVLEHYGFKEGVLVYSPPGVGKTTLLRDTARTLSSSPYYLRISLIDSRGELEFPSPDQSSTLDVYRFYPPSVAIECAIRTMSPQMIICDEIGGKRESDAILYSLGKGVPILASAHGKSLGKILQNGNIARLHSAGAFACYVGLTREGAGDLKYRFDTAPSLDKI